MEGRYKLTKPQWERCGLYGPPSALDVLAPNGVITDHTYVGMPTQANVPLPAECGALFNPPFGYSPHAWDEIGWDDLPPFISVSNAGDDEDTLEMVLMEMEDEPGIRIGQWFILQYEGNFLTETDVEKMWKERCEDVGGYAGDEPARRQDLCNFIDALQTDGQITAHQAEKIDIK